MVLESEKLTRDLTRRFENERTSLGEPITVVRIDKSKGVVERDEAYLRQMREAAIKEYFFGDVQRTLSPGTQMADFDSLAIFRFRESKFPWICFKSKLTYRPRHPFPEVLTYMYRKR